MDCGGKRQRDTAFGGTGAGGRRLALVSRNQNPTARAPHRQPGATSRPPEPASVIRIRALFPSLGVSTSNPSLPRRSYGLRRQASARHRFRRHGRRRPAAGPRVPQLKPHRPRTTPSTPRPPSNGTSRAAARSVRRQPGVVPLSRRLGASVRAARTRRMPGILQEVVMASRPAARESVDCPSVSMVRGRQGNSGLLGRSSTGSHCSMNAKMASRSNSPGITSTVKLRIRRAAFAPVIYSQTIPRVS